jgi:polyribonucleotide nucleotidyltransferase
MALVVKEIFGEIRYTVRENIVNGKAAYRRSWHHAIRSKHEVRCTGQATGTSLFTRGETRRWWWPPSVPPATYSYSTLEASVEYFMLHYNFPPCGERVSYGAPLAVAKSVTAVWRIIAAMLSA